MDLGSRGYSSLIKNNPVLGWSTYMMLRLLIAVCCGLAVDAASTGRSPWDRLSIGVSSSPPKVRNELVGGHLYLSLHSSANGGAGCRTQTS
jgi:hypothetical protein